LKMPRLKVTENPVYRECELRLAPLKLRVEKRRAEAEALVAAEKRAVEFERLAIVRYGLENGLSQYAVSKLFGITAGDAQRKLVADAMGVDWVASEGKSSVPVVVFEGVGTESNLPYRAVLVSFEAPVNAWGKAEVSSRWAVSHDLWGTFEFVQAGALGWSCVPENVEDAIRGGDMPDDVFNGMRSWRPEAI
jgi:hypothetical protein